MILGELKNAICKGQYTVVYWEKSATEIHCPNGIDIPNSYDGETVNAIFVNDEKHLCIELSGECNA